MSAAAESLAAREPSAKYLASADPALLRGFELLATAPGGIARLRQLIAMLAVRGMIDDRRGAIADAQPSSWRTGTLGDVVTDSEAGWSPSCDSGPRSGDGWGVLKVSAVSWGEFRNDENKRLPSHLVPRLALEVKEEDFLLSRANTAELVARSVVAFKVQPRLMLSDKIIRLRFSQRADPLFFNIVNNAPDARAYYARSASGTSSSMKNVSRAVVLALPVPIPPLAEQHRIVARVEELMKLCDALEHSGRLAAEMHARLTATLFDALAASESANALTENWQRVAEHFDLLLDRPKMVDAFEQTITRLAVRGLLVKQDSSDGTAHDLLAEIAAEKRQLAGTGKIRPDKEIAHVTHDERAFEVPDSWVWTRFGLVCINRDGERVPVASVDRERLAKTFDYYGASGVIDKIDRFLFDKTLLLIGEDGANLINRSTPIAFLARGKYWVNNHAHVIDATHEGLLDYLCLYINATSLEPYVTGTAQPKMNQAKLNSIPVALPPLAEQKRIVARVEELRRLCSDLRQRLTQARETQSRLADALVAEAA